MERRWRSFLIISIFALLTGFLFLKMAENLSLEVQQKEISHAARKAVLKKELCVIDKIQTKSVTSVSPEILSEYDKQCGVNFSSQLITFEPKYLIREREKKESEDRELGEVTVWTLIPKWRVLFLASLGIVFTKLLNELINLVPSLYRRAPRETCEGIVFLVLLAWYMIFYF